MSKYLKQMLSLRQEMKTMLTTTFGYESLEGEMLSLLEVVP